MNCQGCDDSYNYVKAPAIFHRSNIAFVGSDPTRGMDIYDFSVFVFFCICRSSSMGGSPYSWSPKKCLKFALSEGNFEMEQARWLNPQMLKLRRTIPSIE
jgi:hypothetical protein